MAEQLETTLGELADFINGDRGKNYPSGDAFVAIGIPFVGAGDFNDGIVDGANAKKISRDSFDRLGNGKVARGDTLLCLRGSLGKVARIADDSEGAIASSLVILRPREEVDSRYLYYLLTSPIVQVDALALDNGSVQPNLSVREVSRVRVPWHSYDEQRRIAHILGTLDDKIELNRRMNETLEEMARALFKSWFVDFDPVRAKAEGRDPALPKYLADLFPDRLVDSELGEIPEGWNCTALGEIVREHREGVNPLDAPDDVFDHFSIPAYDAGRMPIRELGAEIRSLKHVVPQGAVLLSKLNPETGRVWAPDLGEGARSVCSTEFVVLTPQPPIGRAWLEHFLSSDGTRERLAGLVTGTSRSHQRVQMASLVAVPVVSPTRELLGSFEALASPWITRSRAATAESAPLAGLRANLVSELIGAGRKS